MSQEWWERLTKCKLTCEIAIAVRRSAVNNYHKSTGSIDNVWIHQIDAAKQTIIEKAKNNAVKDLLTSEQVKSYGVPYKTNVLYCDCRCE